MSRMSMLDDLLAELIDRYPLLPPIEVLDVPLHSVNNRNVALRTGAGAFVAKRYTGAHDEASIRYEQAILTALARADLPFAVPTPIAGCDGDLLQRGSSGLYALSALLPGARLNPLSAEQVELLGAAAGELQVALAQLPPAPRPGRALFADWFGFPSSARDPLALTAAMLGLPGSGPLDDLLAWWRDEAPRLQAFIAGPYRSLPWQLCHNDLTPANVLVEDGRVSAILDFEFAVPAPRALDMAMCLRMTMRWWENRDPWEQARRFFRGYAGTRRLSEAEAQALPALIRLRAAGTVLWWLGRAVSDDDLRVVPARIASLRETASWLNRHGERLVEYAVRT